MSSVSPALRIEKAVPADIPLILSLIRELAEFERLSHQMQVTEADLRETLFGARPFAEVVVGRLGSEPVGFALFFHNYSTFLGKPGMYLEDLYIQPAFRSMGIGKALLVRLAALAVERGYGRFEWCVLDWNEPAIRFYDRMGATMLPEWRLCRVTGEALERFGA